VTSLLMHQHVCRNENSISDRQRVPLFVSKALEFWLEPRPSTMPDDIATYLFLDETVLGRLQCKRPTGWAFSSTSERMLVVLRSVGEITDSSLPDSTNRLLLFAAGAAFACAVVGVAWYWASTGRFIESTDDAYVGGEVTTLSAKVAGFIEAVTVADNQSVKAGDLLLKLDDRDYRAQLARAEAGVAAQRATLANIEANRRMHRAVVEQASADVGGAAAELARTKYDLDRYRTLSNDKIASSQRFEQADADHEKARAAERRARAALQAAERQLDVIDTQKQQTQAALDQALAERDLALLNLAYTEIHSPIDGVVGNRSARAGAYATVGAQLLAIVPARGLWVDANFKESQLAHIREGQSAEVVADVLPGVSFRGRVASLAPATGAQFSVIPPENATGNFTKIIQRVPVRIELEGADAELGKLRPGFSVAVHVDRRHSFTVRAAQR
jgi:membrane fusion protein (multidrug efflux system)